MDVSNIRGRPAGRRRGRLVALLALMSTHAGCGGDRPEVGSDTTADRLPETLSETCPAAIREPLTLADGTEAYIEAENVALFGSRVLVSGAPSYTWDIGSPPNATTVSRNAHVAAYIGGDGPTLVEKPVDGTIGSVRTTPLGDGRWAALLSEVEPDSLPAVDHVLGLTYAEFDGERWSPVEPVPLAPDGPLSPRISSSLVRVEERLVWVVVQHVPTDRANLLYYERRDGVWSVRVVTDAWVEVAALAVGPPSDLWLAVVSEDPDLPGWQKSLRLYRQASSWELVSRVAVAEPGTEIYDPKVTVLPGGVTVSWRSIGSEGSVGLARVGIRRDGGGTTLVLDASAEQVTPLAMFDGGPAWVVDHRNLVTGRRELRLLRLSPQGVSSLAAVPNPYTGFFAALPTSLNEVLIVGPEFNPDSAYPIVRSLILRFSTSCT